MADHPGTRAGTESPDARAASDVDPGVSTEPAETHGGAAYHVLGLFIAGLGVAHLLKRRYFPTLVPDWLGPVRHELDMASGGMKVLTGLVVMLIPLLRRWGNMAPVVSAAGNDVGHL
jgi:hypothetical protein